VGNQDQTTPCPLGGKVRVYGNATSNAVQGATMVDVTYDFDGCGYSQKDVNADQNYQLTIQGSIQESGTLAVQPSATTALIIKGESVDMTGTVSDPAIKYDGRGCKIDITQDGNLVSGTLCGRDANFNY
jgi:hypothetical protein